MSISLTSLRPLLRLSFSKFNKLLNLLCSRMFNKDFNNNLNSSNNNNISQCRPNPTNSLLKYKANIFNNKTFPLINNNHNTCNNKFLIIMETLRFRFKNLKCKCNNKNQHQFLLKTPNKWKPKL